MFTRTCFPGFYYTNYTKVQPGIVVLPLKTSELDRIWLTLSRVVVKRQSNNSCSWSQRAWSKILGRFRH